MNLLRLPQGLNNLSEVVLYLDDVSVFSSTFEVFTRIKDNGLKLKGSKCKLFQTSVSHLGHVVSDQGIPVDEGKIVRIRDWPTPNNSNQLRSFLGLAPYYRRYVKGFSAIAAPLHALSVKAHTKAGKRREHFIWTRQQKLKTLSEFSNALCEAPVLALVAKYFTSVLICVSEVHFIDALISGSALRGHHSYTGFIM